MKPTVCVVQHVPFETAAHIQVWADKRDLSLSVCHVYRGEAFPQPEQYDWLILMGGPMSANDRDRLPWLEQELAGVRLALEQDQAILGICLGAQVLAQAAGGRVVPNAQPEIGWFPVSLTDSGRDSPLFGALPSTFEAFHWHGEMCRLPSNVPALAASEACPVQAFAPAVRALGLQFHLESTRQSVADLITHCGPDLVAGPWVMSTSRMQGDELLYARSNRLMDSLLDRLLASWFPS